MVSRIGEKFITNEGYNIEIIDYNKNTKYSIKFDNKIIKTNLDFKEIKNGSISNPLHKSLCGVGYIGIGRYVTSNNKEKTKEYSYWHGIINRCYNKKRKNGNNFYEPMYAKEIWHNFQNFAEWMEQNYNPKTMDGWHLDKDILIKGNKVYSPETCCFVPQEINTVFTKRQSKRGDYPIGVTKVCSSYKVQLNIYGILNYLGTFKTIEEAFQVYKEAKENYIKEVADKWKDLIDPRVYEAMHNYQVEITD